MKKAQTEILGVVIIIALLLVFGIFYLKFSSNTSTLIPEMRTNIQTNNLLQALLKININNEPFDSLIYKCYSKKDCSTLNKELPKIISLSLNNETQYKFTISENNKAFFTLGSCSSGITANYPISKNGLIFDTNMLIC
ncbi:MAG: hypothetical protein NT139_02200 [Candidatus Woesearchaeota archaeon]|nr:hypothetical protein [Candidatus Woesearchaeota archaeon]